MQKKANNPFGSNGTQPLLVWANECIFARRTLPIFNGVACFVAPTLRRIQYQGNVPCIDTHASYIHRTTGNLDIRCFNIAQQIHAAIFLSQNTVAIDVIWNMFKVARCATCHRIIYFVCRVQFDSLRWNPIPCHISLISNGANQIEHKHFDFIVRRCSCLHKYRCPQHKETLSASSSEHSP